MARKKLTRTKVKIFMNDIVKKMYQLGTDKVLHGSQSNVPFSYNMLANLQDKLIKMRDKTL